MLKKCLIGLALLSSNIAAAAVSIPTNLEFTLKNGTPDREVFRMADHPTGVFVFEAFSAGCGGCNDNAEAVNQLAADYKHESRVHVFDLGLDTNELYYREWIRKHNPNHMVVMDIGHRIYKTLQSIERIPQTFVVNCKGELIGSVLGQWEAADALEARALVDKGLRAKCN